MSAQTTASLPSITDGRHGVRDECQLHRPPRCSILGRGSAPSSSSHRSILCLPERDVFEVDPREEVHAHAPLHQPPAAHFFRFFSDPFPYLIRHCTVLNVFRSCYINYCVGFLKHISVGTINLLGQIMTKHTSGSIAFKIMGFDSNII